MNLSSRLAAASGAAAVAAAGLLLAQRFPGSVASVLLLVLAAQASAQACGLDATKSVRSNARHALRRQAAFAPAWVLGTLAACTRAGSALVGDIAGAHAVAGIGLVRGPLVTVAGMWFGVIALSVCVAATAGSFSPTVPDVDRPYAVDRIGALAAVAQVGFVVALFAGPQIRGASDSVPWAVASLAVGVWAWFGRAAARAASAPLGAGVLAAIALALTLIGGKP